MNSELKNLFIGGFGWTGSGALIDYIADFHNVFFVRKDREETSFLKGVYSFSNILRKMEEGQDVDAELVLKALTYMRGRSGVSDNVIPSRERVNVKRYEQLRYFLGDFLDRAIDKSEGEIVDLLSGNLLLKGRLDDFQKIVERFFQDLFYWSVESQGVSCNGAKYVVSNNDPSGYSVDVFELLSSDLYTVVVRNYYDVFADLIRLSKVESSEKDLENFIRAQKNKMNEFSKIFEGSYEFLRERVCLVSFEVFVTDVSARNVWAKMLGLSDFGFDAKYDAGKSQNNIGIHKKYFSANFDYSRIDELEEMRASLVRRAKGAGLKCIC